jgi:hypothetical protein
VGGAAFLGRFAWRSVVGSRRVREWLGRRAGVQGTEKRFSDGADFIDVVTVDKLAATCGQYLTKGREVAVA